MDNQQGPAVQHRELCSMLCGSLDGRELWGRMDTCIWMAESLHCLPETIRTFFIAILQYKIKSFLKWYLHPNVHSSTIYSNQGWDDLGKWHWNMYNIIYEMSRQSRFDARYWMLGAGALGQPRGMVQGGRWEEGSGWEIHVHPWWIHVNVWQNHYNIVK